MNSNRIAQMQNTMGRFAQNIYIGRYDRCAALYASGEETYIHDFDTKEIISGFERIQGYFAQKQESIGAGWVNREILILNTPSFRWQEEIGTGIWEAFTFTMKSEDESGRMIVEPGFCRLDCDFVLEDGKVRIRRMDRYQLMNWLPWTCTIEGMPAAVPSWSESETLEDIGAEDFVQLERLISRFSHTHREAAKEIFAVGADTSFYLSAHMDQPAKGYENVMACMDELQKREADNSELFICVPYTTAPVILTSDSGNRAVGSWIIMSFDLQGALYGYTKESAKVERRIGMLNASFVCQNGEWKIEAYHYAARECFEPVKLLARGTKATWQPAAMPTGNNTCAADVFEIQGLMLEWVERLKVGRLMEYPNLYMSSAKDELTMWLGENPDCNYKGYTRVMEDLARMSGDYSKNKYKTAIIHSAMTPLIEVSEDGSMARGQWLDQCYTDLSQITGDYTLPLPAMVNGWKYQHVFRKENGHWKMLHFTATEWADMEHIHADPRSWHGWVTTTDNVWPMPYEKYGE